MAKKVVLKDNSGNKCYPVTRDGCVLSGNKTLPERFSEVVNQPYTENEIYNRVIKELYIQDNNYDSTAVYKFLYLRRNYTLNKRWTIYIKRNDDIVFTWEVSENPENEKLFDHTSRDIRVRALINWEGLEEGSAAPENIVINPMSFKIENSPSIFSKENNDLTSENLKSLRETVDKSIMVYSEEEIESSSVISDAFISGRGLNSHSEFNVLLYNITGLKKLRIKTIASGNLIVITFLKNSITIDNVGNINNYISSDGQLYTVSLGNEEEEIDIYHDIQSEETNFIAITVKKTLLDNVSVSNLTDQRPLKIIDNINSDSSGDALSAKQGKLLGQRILTLENSYGKKFPFKKIYCWGNSITDGGSVWQRMVATILGVDASLVINCGRASDWSQHIKRRFISYFTDETPYRGNEGTDLNLKPSVVPSLQERLDDLKNSFFIFWVGTNNLGNTGSNRNPTFTTNNDDFNANCPNYDFKQDSMYARSYKDQLINDLREMIALLGHNNFIIITGHGAFNEAELKYQLETETDLYLQRVYPNNFVNVREAVQTLYNYGSCFVDNDFVIPQLQEQVSIDTRGDISWINGSLNSSNKICIGTKDLYDTYEIISKTENSVTAKLLEHGTPMDLGGTMIANYPLTSDNGRTTAVISPQIYSYEDIQRYKIGDTPYSISDKGLHYITLGYELIGKVIGNAIIQKKFILVE